jgi:hypothetical protein
MLKTCSIKSTIAFAAIAITGLATSAMAQAQAVPTSTCPARYEPMDELCFNKASGDIVLAKTPAALPTFTNANCRAGYEIIFETLCISKTTGDIVSAEPFDAMQTAKK